VTAFDLDESNKAPLLKDRAYTEDEMWENLEYWIKIIVPVAEEEEIRIGIHPCDPPVEQLKGIPQLFRSFDAYKRLINIVESPSNCIEFCQGSFSEMADAKADGIYEMIEYFGERKKILYVHFRNVSGTVPSFREEFINTGHVDMHRAMQTYKKVGFEGMFVDDHVPVVIGDSPWGHRGRAFANGYIQALIDGVK
jgi:mannonate dehydratase